MKYKIIIPVTVFVAIAAVAYIFFGRSEKSPKAEVVELPSKEEADSEAPILSEPSADGVEDHEEKHHDDVASEEDEVDENEQKPESEGAQALDSNKPKNEQMREAMKAQVNASMKRAYSDLYADLELSPADEEKVTSLLADRALTTMELTMSFFKKGGHSKEDQANKLKELAQIKKDSNVIMKRTLGDEKYAKFEHYEDTKGQRQYVKSFAAKLEEAGTKISRDVQNRLTDIMYEEQTRSPIVREFMDPNNLDPAKLTKENLRKMMDEREKSNVKILSRAKNELSPEQFEAFKKMQDRVQAMEKAAFN